MGSYHELVLNVDLKEDTPDEKIKEINDFMNSYLFRHCYYFKGLLTKEFEVDKIDGLYKLSMRGMLKDYDNRINEFLELIKEHLAVDDEEDEFLGYYRYEETREPTLLYLVGGEIIEGKKDWLNG